VARPKVEDLYLTEYLTCRVRRHTWEEIPDDGGSRRQWKTSRTVVRLCQRCTRCGTKRYEAWNGYTGEILFVDYRYPSEYALDAGGDRGGFNRTLRREYLSRRESG
jgi:hypothetical protein